MLNKKFSNSYILENNLVAPKCRTKNSVAPKCRTKNLITHTY